MMAEVKWGLATMVLWAKSETIGHAGGGENSVNSKHEIRNPKQYQNNNDQNMKQTANKPGPFLFDGFVNSHKMLFSVIPAQAGIQCFQALLDSRLCGSDDSWDFLRVHLV